MSHPKPVKCPTCNTFYSDLSEQGCAVDIQGECISCLTAHQKQVYTERIEEASLERIKLTTVVKEGGIVRVFTVTVCCDKEIKALDDLIGGRLWSMQHVQPNVKVVEVTK